MVVQSVFRDTATTASDSNSNNNIFRDTATTASDNNSYNNNSNNNKYLCNRSMRRRKNDREREKLFFFLIFPCEFFRAVPVKNGGEKTVALRPRSEPDLGQAAALQSVFLPLYNKCSCRFIISVPATL